MRWHKLIGLCALLAYLPVAHSQTWDENECRRYRLLLSQYERDGVTTYNGITGQVQRLSEAQSQLRIERMRQLIRERCARGTR